MNSTRSTLGRAAASCKSAATPSAVFQPWPTYLTPKSWAIHAIRRLHEERAIGLGALPIGAAEQAADRLAGGLAEDVPECDVDAADRMGEGAAAPHPEGVLVELLGDALGLEGVLAAEQRLEPLEAGGDQPAVGKDAAMADDAGIGMDGDQRMDRVLGPDLGRPAAFRAFAEQRHGGNRHDSDFPGFARGFARHWSSSSIHPMRLDEVGIDLDADPGNIRDENRPVILELERRPRDAAREGALTDVEFDETGAPHAGSQLQVEPGQEIRH